jgi:phage terminase large subunit GpA-like protein
MASGPDVYGRALLDGLEPDDELTVHEWADANRVLTSMSSAEPGRWRTSRTPYLREPMDCLSPSHPCRRTVMQFAAQQGKTEVGNCWIGAIIHRWPAPILMVLPTVEVAKKVSKQRITPMILGSEVLRDRVRDAHSRGSGNTVQVKEFPGGVLMMTGANSGAGLRSMPIKYLFLDEIDKFPGDVDGEGDPVSLAEKRTSTFSRRKVLLTSTPTIKGISRIERELLKSDLRKYFIPCPACGFMDLLTWREVGHHRIEWDEGRPETAHMVCSSCEAAIPEWHKAEMLARGEWRPTQPGNGITVGFHLSALYSPLGWKAWRDCVEEFLDAKDDPLKLRVWVNTVLAETWEERGTSVEAGALRKRCVPYEAEIPRGVGVLIAAVDTQIDRLECMVYGYGAGEESWLVSFTQLFGDPSGEAVWYELDRFLEREYVHESGRRFRAECTVVDSGGAHTEQVYRYVAGRARRHVYAIKGGSYSGRPLVERPSTSNRYRVPLFVLCVDTGKEVVVSRFQISAPGPGYVHLPEWVDEETIAQFAAERAVRKYVKGRGSVRVWLKQRERNEALDMTVYALAGLFISFPQPGSRSRLLEERAARWAAPLDPGPGAGGGDPPPGPPEPPADPVAPRRFRQGGWVSGYRR